MEYSADELEAPDWMNVKFFEKAMQLAENDKTITVTGVNVRPGTKPGDHFASIMFKVTIDYKSKSNDHAIKKVVIKTTPTTEGMKMDMMKDVPLFETEIRMYTKTLPEMERYFKAAGETFMLAPPFLYASQEPRPVIILEDISPGGYIMFDKPMNVPQSFMVFKRLAEFHAASLYLQENDGNLAEFNKSIFTQENAILDLVMKDAMHIFTNELKTWGPDYETYYEKFEKIKDQIIKPDNGLFDKNEDGNGYNVLTHGDFQYKNFLVKLDKGIEKMENLVLLDFQVCYWASPALDILNALYLMIDTPVRAGHRQELITYYYNEFDTTLKKLGYLGKVPSLIDLNIELLKKGNLEVVTAVCFLPFYFVDSVRGDILLEDFFKKDQTDMKVAIYRSTEYLSAIRAELPRFLHNGFLN